MSAFSEGQFIRHNGKGYGFLLEKSRTEGGWMAFHPDGGQHWRHNQERFMAPADREPTDDELRAYITFVVVGENQ